MTKCKKGNVILTLFPDSNLKTAKKRPALVVQDDDLNTGLHQIIVALITSNLARAHHPSRVAVSRDSSEGSQSGLQLDSVIVADNLATIHTHFIHKVIGSLPTMDAVERALAHTFGLKLADGDREIG